MPAATKMKACLACESSKRRCDKQSPQCGRCAERDVPCEYPSRKMHRQRPGPLNALLAPRPLGGVIGTSSSTSGTVDLDLDSFDWMLDEAATSLSFPITDHSIQDLVSQNPSFDLISMPPVTLQTPASTDDGPIWFLHPSAWELHDHYPIDTVFPPSILKSFLKSTMSQLETWSRTGANGFIHSELYSLRKGGMPEPLQSAFSDLAAYLSRTPATEDIILHIAETRANTIVTNAQQDVGSLGDDPMRLRLAHLQALFVYTVVRLCDGCVRQRALAERHVPILTRWCANLLQSAAAEHLQRLPVSEYLLVAGSSSARGREISGPQHLWDAWVLTESVRRTWLAVSFFVATYEGLRYECTDCFGGIMFTARRGLWEAQSAAKWVEGWRGQDPLFLKVLRPGKDSVGDIDDFASFLFTVVYGCPR